MGDSKVGARRDYFNRMNKPTVLQIHYLEELGGLDSKQRKRGAVSIVAERCGVNHAAVSRFFKRCHEAGYIDDRNRLTEDGEEWLTYYTGMIERVRRYLKDTKIPEDAMERSVCAMVEDMDDFVLNEILDNNSRMQKRIMRTTYQEIPRSKSPLNGLIDRGTYQVGFRVLKLARGSSQVVNGLSMADAGFEKPAILKVNNRGIFVELTVKELVAKSRINGFMMHGHLTSLKYERDGELFSAQIRRGKVLIPLDACEHEIRENGAVTGMIAVTLACSVGRIHMPESAAMLVFWL